MEYRKEKGIPSERLFVVICTKRKRVNENGLLICLSSLEQTYVTFERTYPYYVSRKPGRDCVQRLTKRGL